MKTKKVPFDMAKIVAIIAALFSLFHLWTSFAGTLPNLQQVYGHLGFALVLIFFVKPAFAKRNSAGWTSARWILDGALVAASAAISMYAFFNYLEISQRGASDPSETSIWMGIAAVVLVIEATRRTIGWALPILAIIFLAYAMLGPYLPGPLIHRGYDIERLAATLYLTDSGLAGAPLQVSATYVAIFIIFAAFLDTSGAGKFFIDWSYSGLGWFRGGPAKVAVVGSALMGTISGSSVANVASTGAFTIPVMKRSGLEPRFAGAVEAAASTGGQIMPPVMGAAAFIMVEFLAAPYSTIMAGAIVPGMLYFLAVMLMVDFEVAKRGIRGVPRSELPNSWEVFKRGWHLLTPLVVLIYLLIVVEYSPVLSAFYAVCMVIIVSFLRGATRMNPERVSRALSSGGIGMLEVAAACACAGILIGVLMLTGLAMRMSDIVIDLAGGSLPLLMILTMFISLILGMGQPTSAVYVILATLIVPAMVQLGVEPLAAHLFAFYYGVLANVTPPVGIAAYAAAGLSGANAQQTGLTAFKIALAGFLLPFIWVYDPALILQGEVSNIVFAVSSAIVGIFALASAMQGYLFGCYARLYERLLLGLSSLALLVPGMPTDIAGVGFIAAALASWFFRDRKWVNRRVALGNEEIST